MFLSDGGPEGYCVHGPDYFKKENKRPPQGTLGYLAPRGYYADDIDHRGLTDLGKMTNLTFQRFDPTLIGKRPQIPELQKPMKIDLPETPIAMLGKMLADELYHFSKGISIEILGISIKAVEREDTPSDPLHSFGKVMTITADVRVVDTLKKMSIQDPNRFTELLVHRFLYEKAKLVSSLPVQSLMDFNIKYM